MSINQTKKRYLSLSNNFNLTNKLTFLLFPLIVLSIAPPKTLGIEEDITSKELSNPKDTNGMSQITNVNQLRDVAPTDWAYEALRSLVDRYGCISGFPKQTAQAGEEISPDVSSQTYRGNQPLSRYEFAAGLNSCLNQIERLITSSESVSPSDLKTVQRLRQDFAAELAIVADKVDTLENQIAILEDNQFSTTTKLSGNVFLNATGATAGGVVKSRWL